MLYLYFDESGDLGFDFSKKGTSRMFSIAMLIISDKRPVVSLVKKVFTSLPKATKRKNSGTLHAYYEKSSTINRMLRDLSEKEIKIASIRLDKCKILIASNPNDLYANLVITLINRLFTDGLICDFEDITLVASRRNTSANLNARFTESIINNTLGTKFYIDIVKPSDDKCLQAADFVSWAFWQKYERKDSTYTDLLSGRIVKEYVMYS